MSKEETGILVISIGVVLLIWVIWSWLGISSASRWWTKTIIKTEYSTPVVVIGFFRDSPYR